MGITLESTTDTKEDLQKAQGSFVEEKKVESSENDEKTIDDKAIEISEETEVDFESENDGEIDEEIDEEIVTDDKPKKKGGFKKRIDKLNNKISIKEQEIEYWKAEALKGNKVVEKKANEVINDVKDDNLEPDPDNFDTHKDYVKAVSKWTVKLEESERELRQKAVETKNSYDKKISDFKENVKEFKKSHDDFDKVLNNVDDVMLNYSLHDLIINSENGPDLMYDLAKNKKELERINGLSPLMAAKEIGKLEAKYVVSSENKKEIKITNAPEPISMVGSRSVNISKDPEKMSFKEYKQWRLENK